MVAIWSIGKGDSGTAISAGLGLAVAVFGAFLPEADWAEWKIWDVLLIAVLVMTVTAAIIQVLP